MAAFDEILYSPGEAFQNVYDKVNDTFTALKAGTPGQVLTGNGIGSAPTFETPVIFTTIVNIGDWNMDSNPTVAVAHGISDYKKIRGISVIIRDDADSVYSPLNSCPIGTNVDLNGSVVSVGSTNITLFRSNSGDFNSTNYNSTPYNRGFITIQYT